MWLRLASYRLTPTVAALMRSVQRFRPSREAVHYRPRPTASKRFMLSAAGGI